jgi:hypothetical protein
MFLRFVVMFRFVTPMGQDLIGWVSGVNIPSRNSISRVMARNQQYNNDDQECFLEGPDAGTCLQEAGSIQSGLTTMNVYVINVEILRDGFPSFEPENGGTERPNMIKYNKRAASITRQHYMVPNTKTTTTTKSNTHIVNGD